VDKVCIKITEPFPEGFFIPGEDGKAVVAPHADLNEIVVNIFWEVQADLVVSCSKPGISITAYSLYHPFIDVLQELIKNSVDSVIERIKSEGVISDLQPTVSIKIIIKEDSEQLYITYTDNGAGFKKIPSNDAVPYANSPYIPERFSHGGSEEGGESSEIISPLRRSYKSDKLHSRDSTGGRGRGMFRFYQQLEKVCIEDFTFNLLSCAEGGAEIILRSGAKSRTPSTADTDEWLSSRSPSERYSPMPVLGDSVILSNNFALRLKERRRVPLSAPCGQPGFVSAELDDALDNLVERSKSTPPLVLSTVVPSIDSLAEVLPKLDGSAVRSIELDLKGLTTPRLPEKNYVNDSLDGTDALKLSTLSMSKGLSVHARGSIFNKPGENRSIKFRPLNLARNM
jgi:hypothetical protein